MIKMIRYIMLGFTLGVSMSTLGAPDIVVCGAEDEVIVLKLVDHEWVASHCRNFDDLIEEDGRYIPMWALEETCEVNASSTVVSQP